MFAETSKFLLRKSRMLAEIEQLADPPRWKVQLEKIKNL
jgi:hypothetical protein